jgi:hypothetical protein
MPLSTKKRASKQEYQSLTQLTIEGFATPFVEKLDPNNRWGKRIAVVSDHRCPGCSEGHPGR